MFAWDRVDGWRCVWGCNGLDCEQCELLWCEALQLAEMQPILPSVSHGFLHGGDKSELLGWLCTIRFWYPQGREVLNWFGAMPWLWIDLPEYDWSVFSANPPRTGHRKLTGWHNCGHSPPPSIHHTHNMRRCCYPVGRTCIPDFEGFIYLSICVRSEVTSVMTVKYGVFWDVTLCGSYISSQRASVASYS
jgi:hypothetical protein